MIDARVTRLLRLSVASALLGAPLAAQSPLAPDAGWDNMHSWGRRWFSQDDPEWQKLAAWVRGEQPRCLNY